MLDFYLTATDSQGKRDTICIQATSARKAYEQAQADGYVDIVLHTDDAAASVAKPAHTPGKPRSAKKEEKELLTPAEMLRLQDMGDWSAFLFLLVKLYRLHWWLWLSCLAMIAYIYGKNGSLGFLGTIAILVLLMPLGLAIWNALANKSRNFQALLEAACWGRWQEVLDHEPKLRGAVPDFELDIRVATAWIGLGRHEEGMALYRQHENNPDVPHWLYLGRMAGLYNQMHQYDDAVTCHRQAYEEAPDNPTVVIDYAMMLLFNDMELDRAKALLAQAEAAPLSDTTQRFLPYVNGLILLQENQPREASALFQTAIEGLEPLCLKNPVVSLMQDSVRAYKAIALARLGNASEAQQLFDSVRPRFEALNNERIIRRFEQAMAG